MTLKKLKKVSWATGPDFCQVKHYRKEDCPSKVGSRSQQHSQLKQTHQKRLSSKSLAIWKCPPKFHLNKKWLVVAGEESKEASKQEHRKRRVIEAVFPNKSAIPPNPYNLSDLEQSYDDDQTPVIQTTPIEEEADVEVAAQTICCKSPDACLLNSTSSVRIVTSQKLPDNGKSLPKSLSTFPNPRKPPRNSPFSKRSLFNVQSTLPYHSRYQNLKGSEQTQVSPKLPVSYSSVPQYRPTFKNIGTQTETFPDQPANENHEPKYRTTCENQNIPQLKSQVSGMAPAKHNPVTESPSTRDLTVDVATAVAALAKSQEQGSWIDTNLLVRLLLNPEEIPKLMNERGMNTNVATAAAVAVSLNAAMSRPVDLLVPLPRTKPDKVINKPINECQAPHAGSGQSFGPKPMEKSVPLTMTKPETSVKSDLVNEQGTPPQVETANIRESKSLAYSTSDLDLENIKKLISKYGVPDNAGGKPLVNSELVSRYGPTSLQPKLSLSPNVGHTSPSSSMTSHTPLHKDIINYCKSLIKQRGEKSEHVVDESLQNTNPHGTTRGTDLLKNQKPIPRSLTPCVFFNKPKGCHNGSYCRFLHDISGKKRSGGRSEGRDSKRLK
ncbi:zinc finger CCCH domain-containing protein 45-like [Solanum stenotomum]|uniref:zinc finger CCCH domain-containing protein 45-like n=1 Tax=Solanum stenotomum TaxID=172797 RepID=UPI0020D1F3ED|nr:zinc finger CCCH domain-containing protein 45-like [Solanum stenotomum]